MSVIAYVLFCFVLVWILPDFASTGIVTLSVCHGEAVGFEFGRKASAGSRLLGGQCPESMRGDRVKAVRPRGNPDAAASGWRMDALRSALLP